MQIQPVTADIADSLGLKNAEGALVAEPQADGPAAKAGIQAGDVITAVNGKPVKDARDLARRSARMAPGATVKLGVVRKGAEKTVDVTLGELPSEQRQARADRRATASTSRQPTCRGSASRSRPPARSQAPAAKASWSRRSTRTARPPSAASRPAT